MPVTWSSQLHTPVAVTREHTASVTRSFEFFQNKSQFWVSWVFFFFFFNNIHSLLTFKCYPSPPKEHCVKQTENFGNIWKAPVWVSKLKAMGRGKRQRTGYSCPTGSQLLVSTWTVSLPWPTKLDTICSQLSPL